MKNQKIRSMKVHEQSGYNYKANTPYYLKEKYKGRVLQEHRHDQLRSLGYKVFVLDAAGQIGGILDGIQTA